MPDEYNKFNKENVIRQLVEVQAQVTVTPLIEHGTPKVQCINSCICANHEYNNHNYFDCFNDHYHDSNSCEGYDYNAICGPISSPCKYNYTLTQVICIEIPICIDAEVDIHEGIACCGRPDTNPTECINNRKRSYMQLL